LKNCPRHDTTLLDEINEANQNNYLIKVGNFNVRLGNENHKI